MIRSCFRIACFTAFSTIVIGLAAPSGLLAGSVTINPGYDEVHTELANLHPDGAPAGAFIPFVSNPLTNFAFPGVTPTPSYVGTTDTIIHRTSAAYTLVNNGDNFTSALTIAALSLKSDSSVNLGFGVHQYYTSIVSSASYGNITIQYNGVDGGHWSNTFYAVLDLHEDSPTGQVDATVHKVFTGHGYWSVNAPTTGDLASIIAGVNKESNFWMVGLATHETGEGTQHNVGDTIYGPSTDNIPSDPGTSPPVPCLPEPGSIGLLLSGAGIAGVWGWRRSNRKSLPEVTNV